MATEHICRKCGEALAGGARHGFCPRCLVRQASGRVTDAAADSSESWPDVESRRLSPANSSFANSRKSDVPVHFGDYELREEIGRGGMGVVYRARQISLNRVVALKLMAFGPGSSPELVKRFRAEAVAAASLHHPNIVAIHEVGLHGDRHFFVMDYVEGQSLAQLAGHRPLAAKRAAAYLRTVAEAVHYAHERGILHRDLKPSNVLIDEQDQPRVVDFGLAKRLGDSGLSTLNPQLTLTGQVLGSPHYLPPEQAAGQRARISRRTDVYGLGATLYHLLTGRPPFQAESLAQTLDLVRQADPVSPRVLNPAVPVDLETICLKCLEKEPARRYATARELANELARFLAGEPITAHPLGPVGKSWRWCRRRPQVASLAAVAVLATLFGLGSLVWQKQQARLSELKARQNAYVLAINAAEQALNKKELGRAAALLKPQIPVSRSETDLRGFEWRYLWQRCQPDAEAVVGKLPSGVRSMEVSPDGRWLAGGAEFGGIKLWDLSKGEEFTLPSGSVRTFVTFSPDSRLLLFTDQDVASPPPIGKIVVWDLQARRELATIRDLRGIGPIGFSRDGRWFGYGAAVHWVDRKTVGAVCVILDVPGWTKVAERFSDTDQISGFHGYDWVFTRDNRSVVGTAPGSPGDFVVWEFLRGTNAQKFPIDAESVTAMAISPDGRQVATGSGMTETVIRLWEVPGFRPAGQLTGHTRWVAGLKFSPDGRTLASASADRTVRLWDLSARTVKSAPHQVTDEAWRVCFSPDGQYLFGGSRDGFIYRWSIDAEPGKPAALPVRTTHLPGESVVLSPEGTQFAGIRDGVVYLGNAQGTLPAEPIPSLGTNNTCLLFSGNGQFLFAGTQTGGIQVWSLNQQQLLRTLRGSEAPVRRFGQAVGGRTLTVLQWAAPRPKDLSDEPGLTEQSKGNREWFYGLRVVSPVRVGVWSLAQWREQHSFTAAGTIEFCAVSADGRFLATDDARQVVRIWPLYRGLHTNGVASPGSVRGLSFSPDGQFLVAAMFMPASVRVWRMPSLQACLDLPQPDGITALTFTPDSRRLTTGGSGPNAVRLWDVATWQELIALEHPKDEFSTLKFSRNGNRLTAVNRRGELRFWRVAPD